MSEEGPGKRGRGRPKRVTTATESIKRGRGRPKIARNGKLGPSNLIPTKRAKFESTEQTEKAATEDNNDANEQIQIDFKIHIGGSSKSDVQSNNLIQSAKKPKISAHGYEKGNNRDFNISRPDDVEDEEDDRQYWLMKADPRISITNCMSGLAPYHPFSLLKRAEEPRPFAGVRNVAGTAYNAKSISYDPKSTRDNPRWDRVRVHVQFEQKYQNRISLTDHKQYARQGGVLENMQLLKQPQLYVSQVSLPEWKFIVGLAEEDELSGGSDEESVDSEERLEAQLNGRYCNDHWGFDSWRADGIGGFESADDYDSTED
ncbi:MAG: hypothetical protein Q9160_009057 [Pyrenula sp. 1 TL-2023]